MLIISFTVQSESSVDTLHRTIRSLEHKLGVVQGELGSTQTALANSQQDYEQYKVSGRRIATSMSVFSPGPFGIVA